MNHAKVFRAFRMLIVSYGVLALLLIGFLATLPSIASAYSGTPTRDPYSNSDGDGDEPEFTPLPAKNSDLGHVLDCKSTAEKNVGAERAHSTVRPFQAERTPMPFSTRVQLWLLNWLLR
ncbi:MAG: hypothetical protein KJ970_15005 [Candidatus Eisenbacteria bacterium]|uniref:Uncharacterized protein n=1 Tax=Eiseniibacteriota bacterium TaxID=2212470 RepID=A0A948W754_UNCEI|nr:hypothetical protein [Candidatus Eisenbacteria bacterium]MBU1948336.1 hypothetical protein [Candidatus Eisenbacteria bacterium]MBU2692229.1 hypothetical protein [Candidatus Eisenbacteria bacterium]